MNRQSEVNKRAWEIARELQKEQGGKVKDHFKEGIRRAWAEAKEPKQELVVKKEAPKVEVKKAAPKPRVQIMEPADPLMYAAGAWTVIIILTALRVLMGMGLQIILWGADAERAVRQGVRWTSEKVKEYWPGVRDELVRGWRFRTELVNEWR